jgi:hypothetical protein
MPYVAECHGQTAAAARMILASNFEKTILSFIDGACIYLSLA